MHRGPEIKDFVAGVVEKMEAVLMEEEWFDTGTAAGTYDRKSQTNNVSSTT